MLKLTSGNRVFPHRRRLELAYVPELVLAGKGSLSVAPSRALACCAPFRPNHYAMDGSGGNTGRSFTPVKKTKHRGCKGA
jgi:hypothetical protein